MTNKMVIFTSELTLTIINLLGEGASFVLDNNPRSPLSGFDRIGYAGSLKITGEEAADKSIAGAVGVFDFLDSLDFEKSDVAVVVDDDRRLRTLNVICKLV